jgi:hypothetical protein
MSKLALVTGASGGIGLEFARLLAGDGYDLALVARSAEKLEALAKQLRVAAGIRVEAIAMDLSSPDAARAVAQRVPRCDVLINNAGFANNGRFDTLSFEDVRSEIALDVGVLTELTHAYLPGMIARGAGRILNVASTAAFLPGPFMAVYYAAKAYVLSFSEALWEELRGTGVSMTCLAPGATASGFQARAGVENTPLMRLPLANAAAVAVAGYRGMMRGKRLVVPGLTNNIVALCVRCVPRRLLLSVSRKLVENRKA